MRSYSFFTIVLLCLAILVVDILSYYWLRSVTVLLNLETIELVIDLLFWFFSFGLISSILLLKIRLDNIDPRRKQLVISSLYGLTVSSFVPKIIFVIVFSSLYFSNYVFSEKESLLIVPIVGLFSGFLPFFVIVYGVFRSLYRFKVYNHQLKFEGLPERYSGLKIVQISDLHLGSFNFRYHILKRAIKSINHLKPDLIFFTGDLVNNFAWELKGWDKVFDQLQANMGKYAVLGNHDYGDYSKWPSKTEKDKNSEEIAAFYSKIGFKLLKNEVEILEQYNESIAIIGVENWGSPPFKQYGDLTKALKKVKHVPFKILLSHDPTHWAQEVVGQTDIALTLSGHTHGMQAGIQFKNKQWSPIKFKYQHWAGLYSQNNQVLYVNRGLGWLGFPGRLGMRPEITYFDLKSKV